MADFSFEPGNSGSGPNGEVGNSTGGGEPGASGAGVAPSSGGGTIGNVDSGAAIPPKRRRGRPPGSTNRPKPDVGTDAANASGKEGLDLKFKKNDRAKVLQNIAGMHMMAAILTKQPIMQLREDEAKALTNAVCDVADYHHISLDGAGGPMALYLALATTAYGIYVPRIVMLKSLKDDEQVVGVAPATPGAAKADAQNGARPMDFSGDISNTVQ